MTFIASQDDYRLPVIGDLKMKRDTESGRETMDDKIRRMPGNETRQMEKTIMRGKADGKPDSDVADRPEASGSFTEAERFSPA